MKKYIYSTIVSLFCLSVFVSSAIADIPNFGVPTTVPGLQGLDMRASYITHDGQSIYMTIWSGAAQMYDSNWNPILKQWNPPEDINFLDWDGYPTFDPNENIMYYANHQHLYRAPNGTPPGILVPEISDTTRPRFTGDRLYFDRATEEQSDIWYSNYISGSFDTPQKLTDVSTTEWEENCCYITPDGLTMLFSSNRPGGYGSRDIWKATWNGSNWINIKNLGPNVNKSGYVQSNPFYCTSTRVLYFHRRTPQGAEDSLMQAPAMDIILSPNGGENWISGTTKAITWETWDANIIPNVHIEYSSSNGLGWNDVNTVPNTGSYNWLVPQVTSNQCLVRISDANDANVFDVSDNTFTIFVCQLNSKADLDGNCKVDFVDLSLFANDWLKCGDPFDPNCGIYEWLFYNGHNYAHTVVHGNWKDAEAEAVSLGGHLVTINDSEENNWLVTEFCVNEDLWIGLYQDHNDPGYSEPAGGWVWINGETSTYRNWGPNEPTNDPPEEDFAVISKQHSWEWNDVRLDDAEKHGIIEVP